MLGTNGMIYGTTGVGGTSNQGTIFECSPSGELATLRSFNGTNGQDPAAALIQASDGQFYGTCFQGGFRNQGSVFRLAV